MGQESVMPATAGLMTVEEFHRLPDSEAYILELRNGQLVRVTRPKKAHDDRVYRIGRLLRQFADDIGYMKEEFSFRPLPQHELRVADLASVPWERWDAVPDNDNLHGAPDFVVEVASRSNTAEELQEKKQICLDNGCREFWVVYPKLSQIDVSTRQGTRTYRRGERIVLTVFADQEISIDDIFAPGR
jgi:Uma2 family endonuclease